MQGYKQDDLVTYEYIAMTPSGRDNVTGRVVNDGRLDNAGQLVILITRGSARFHEGEVIHVHPAFIRWAADVHKNVVADRR